MNMQIFLVTIKAQKEAGVIISGKIYNIRCFNAD